LSAIFWFSSACHLIVFNSDGVAKTIEVDKLRFTDNDLSGVGTLEYGQFSIVRRGSSRPRASPMLESSRNHIPD
jgi:hypothetical protein